MASLLDRVEKYAMVKDEAPPQGTTVINIPSNLWSRLVTTKDQHKVSPNKKRKIEDKSSRELTPLHAPIQVILQ